MNLLSFTSNKFKFTIVEGNDSILDDSDFCIELLIKKDFLKNLLLRLWKVQAKLPELENPLTKREKQVLQYLADGKNNSEISKLMNVTIHTTKVHIHNIFNKLSVQDRTEAVVKAIKYKIIDI